MHGEGAYTRTLPRTCTKAGYNSNLCEQRLLSFCSFREQIIQKGMGRSQGHSPSNSQMLELGVLPHSPLPALKWFPSYARPTVWFNGSQHPDYTICSSNPGQWATVWDQYSGETICVILVQSVPCRAMP